jgi:hypothetical protein
MFQYWKINELEDRPYAWIFCPKMDEQNSLSVIRKGHKEFKLLEGYIKSKYRGWVACTKLKNAHIMRFMAKVGAQPFEINLQEDKIWFKKDLKE